MEHVGKHLEKAAAGKTEVRQEDDAKLVEWAVREQVIERNNAGGYQVAGAWFEKAGDVDADAEGEDDY